MNTKIISMEEASRLAVEKIKAMSAEKLLGKMEERKNSELALAIRELSLFSHSEFSTSMLVGNYFVAKNMTKLSAMNSEQYHLVKVSTSADSSKLVAA